MTDQRTSKRKQEWAWAFYDWANSSFTTIILTFVFSSYFVKSISGDVEEGTALWGYALAVSGFLLAFLGPICGAVADLGGKLKRWVFAAMLLCLCGTAFLWLGLPQAEPPLVLGVLVAVIVANLGFELSLVFYNALLPQVATPPRMGRVSSMAWGIGYLGGLASLVAVLVLFIGIGPLEPMLPLAQDEAQHIRAVAPFVVLWYAVFSLPFFLLVPESSERKTFGMSMVQKSLSRALQGLKDIWQDKTWRSFMIGSALYRDGLATLFAMGGIYAAGRYGFETKELLIFGIGMNITAGIGCLAAAWIEDMFGSLRVVRFGLFGLLLTGSGILFAPNGGVFIAVALALGLFVGPVQSASRTFVARISAPEKVTEKFGLYAMTGRAASFLGPLAFALATDLFASQTAGMATILLLWGVGLMLILKLRDAS